MPFNIVAMLFLRVVFQTVHLNRGMICAQVARVEIKLSDRLCYFS